MSRAEGIDLVKREFYRKQRIFALEGKGFIRSWEEKQREGLNGIDGALFVIKKYKYRGKRQQRRKQSNFREDRRLAIANSFKKKYFKRTWEVIYNSANSNQSGPHRRDIHKESSEKNSEIKQQKDFAESTTSDDHLAGPSGVDTRATKPRGLSPHESYDCDPNNNIENSSEDCEEELNVEDNSEDEDDDIEDYLEDDEDTEEYDEQISSREPPPPVIQREESQTLEPELNFEPCDQLSQPQSGEISTGNQVFEIESDSVPRFFQSENGFLFLESEIEMMENAENFLRIEIFSDLDF
ncbi:DNA ligase 1-like isoform X2 [Macrosteles quadrilineatus]|uniref:DNA ligase 1-like isoform X2 n=1 Tax=Macrosteles quadrilineatus TaxID=74068 RepID=UPI0023E17502|nr:DNA ligase 1-like isoform X2 [Macrosteles quadrilineatus]XP_054281072.1 DNA ligase 1-like isoform X2 [Macrosteles quadrilineatus]